MPLPTAEPGAQRLMASPALKRQLPIDPGPARPAFRPGDENIDPVIHQNP
jgi:hypothetical protein